MGLDADAKFFYGMSLNHSIGELRRRDEMRNKRRCPKCATIYDSTVKFCQHDGEACEPIEMPMGWIALHEAYPNPVPGAEGLEAIYMDYNDATSYVLAVEESIKQAGELRGGMNRPANPLELGKSLIPKAAWDVQLRELCETLGIAFVDPQFYVGLYLSY